MKNNPVIAMSVSEEAIQSVTLFWIASRFAVRNDDAERWWHANLPPARRVTGDRKNVFLPFRYRRGHGKMFFYPPAVGGDTEK